MSVYRVFVESIRRLYNDGKVSEQRVLDLFANGKISAEEKDYILSAH